MTRPKTTRNHDQIPSMSKEDPAPQSYGELKDDADPLLALADIADSLKYITPNDPELREKILEARKACEEHAQAQLSAPIKGWDDFKDRLVQIERAQKRSRFDENPHTAPRDVDVFLPRHV